MDERATANMRDEIDAALARGDLRFARPRVAWWAQLGREVPAEWKVALGVQDAAPAPSGDEQALQQLRREIDEAIAAGRLDTASAKLEELKAAQANIQRARSEPPPAAPALSPADAIRASARDDFVAGRIDTANAKLQRADALETRARQPRPVSSSGSPAWLHSIPGFGGDNPLVHLVAAVGYVLLLGVMIAGGWPARLLALLAVAALLLGFNSWGLRQRVPPFNSPQRTVAVAGWAGMAVVAVVLGLVALASAPRATPTNQTAATQPTLSPAAEATVAAQVALATQRAIPPTPDAAKQAEAEEHYAAAVAYRDDGQSGLAMEEGRQALGLVPDHTGAKTLVGEIAAEATATAQQAQAAATAEAQQARAAATAEAQAARAQATASAQAASARATEAARPTKANATVLDPRRLVAEPNSFKGQNIALQGKALNVDQRSDYTWVQLMAQPPGRTTTESVVVELRPKSTEVLKDECYRMYGVVSGTQRVTRTLTGASSDVPLVAGYAWEKARAGEYGFGCAAP